MGASLIVAFDGARWITPSVPCSITFLCGPKRGGHLSTGQEAPARILVCTLLQDFLAFRWALALKRRLRASTLSENARGKYT